MTAPVTNKGTLTVDGNKTSVVEGVTLTNDGTLNIGDSGSSGSGNALSWSNSPGTLVNDADGTINLADESGLNPGTVDNRGTINTTGTPTITNLEPDGGSLSGDSVVIDDLTVPSGGGTLNSTADAAIEGSVALAGASGLLQISGGSTVKLQSATVTAPVTNKGTLTVDGNETSVVEGVTLTNDGTLNIGDSGSSGSGNALSWSNSPGTLVNDADGTINLADESGLNPGTVDNRGTINTTGTPTITNLEPDGGSLSGDSVVIDDLTVPSGGGTLNSTADAAIEGSVALAGASGLLQISGGSTVKLQSATVTAPVTNKGTLTVDGNETSVVEGVTLTNDGTLNIGDSGSSGSGNALSWSNSPGTLVNDADGTINLADESGLNPGTVDNRGTINTTGTPTITNLEPDGGSLSGDSVVIDDLTVPSGGGTLNSTADAAIEGSVALAGASGLLQISGGSTVKLQSATVTAPVTNKGTLTVDGNETSVVEGVTLTNDGTLNIGDSGSSGSGNALSWSNSPGTLVNDADGTINLADESGLNPGTVDNRGTINTTGTPTITNLEPDGATSTLDISLNPHGTGSLNVSGPLSLGGVLEISQSPSYAPALGTTLSVINGASVTGTFAAVTGTRNAGRTWLPVYGASSVQIQWEPAPPLPPTHVTAVAGDSSAVVSWTAPADPGGSPIASYTVTASPGGATISVVAPATGVTVTGLTNGTPYTFAVTATNAQGTSSPSSPSSSITPTTTTTTSTTTSSNSLSSSTSTTATTTSTSGVVSSSPSTSSATATTTSSGSGKQTTSTTTTTANGGALGSTTTTLTPAQQLTKALAICSRLKNGKRAGCVAAARKRYRAQELSLALKTCTKLKKPKKRAACVAAARKRYS